MPEEWTVEDYIREDIENDYDEQCAWEEATHVNYGYHYFGDSYDD